MRITKREDGTVVADFQGLHGWGLQLAVRGFIERLSYGDKAEIILDDPETHEPIIMALREQCLSVQHDDPSKGTFVIKVRK